ncbi:hypothetical protein HUJ04_005367 [Dendroctonus ponderosae]|nr:hypothetical protein HUJ04_005367 [Dendroctonus ponderosae]
MEFHQAIAEKCSNGCWPPSIEKTNRINTLFYAETARKNENWQLAQQASNLIERKSVQDMMQRMMDTLDSITERLNILEAKLSQYGRRRRVNRETAWLLPKHRKEKSLSPLQPKPSPIEMEQNIQAKIRRPPPVVVSNIVDYNEIKN